MKELVITNWYKPVATAIDDNAADKNSRKLINAFVASVAINRSKAI